MPWHFLRHVGSKLKPANHQIAPKHLAIWITSHKLLSHQDVKLPNVTVVTRSFQDHPNFFGVPYEVTSADVSCLDPAPDASNAQGAAPWLSDTWSDWARFQGGYIGRKKRWRKRKNIPGKSVCINLYVAIPRKYICIYIYHIDII